jgi:proteasome assembly chaperone (PAC2) family protein
MDSEINNKILEKTEGYKEQIKKMKRREMKLIFIFQEFQEHLSQYGQYELMKRMDEINEKYKI